jgi:serine/threonine protein kinase
VSLTSEQMTNDVDRGRMEHIAGGEMVQSAAEAPGELEPGQLFAGRYHVERRLGEGDRKYTYLAEDVKVGDRLVALSVVKPHASVLDPDGTKREANLLSRVKNHTHIVAFYDYGADGPVQYLVFEYLSGGTLAERIERTETAGELIPPDVVVRYGRQLAGALAQIHAAGIIHRDVTPHNIWLSDRQKAKLGDFDSAVLLDGEPGPRPITTEDYASPEERHGDPVDQRSDLYSLGRVLISLALGELASGDPAVVRESRLDLPPAFHDLLASLAAPSPDDRPSSAEEVLDRLNEIRHRGMDIYAVIAEGEGSQVEFKSSLHHRHGPLSQELQKKIEAKVLQPHQAESEVQKQLKIEVTKTVAAFLNTNGGTLLIGVSDSGTVLGIEPDFAYLGKGKNNADGWLLSLRDVITRALGAEVWSAIHVSLVRHGPGTVAVVRCPARASETWHTEGGNERFYMRAANATLQLDGSQLLRYIREQWPP